MLFRIQLDFCVKCGLRYLCEAGVKGELQAQLCRASQLTSCLQPGPRDSDVRGCLLIWDPFPEPAGREALVWVRGHQPWAKGRQVREGSLGPHRQRLTESLICAAGRAGPPHVLGLPYSRPGLFRRAWPPVPRDPLARSRLRPVLGEACPFPSAPRPPGETFLPEVACSIPFSFVRGSGKFSLARKEQGSAWDRAGRQVCNFFFHFFHLKNPQFWKPKCKN